MSTRPEATDDTSQWKLCPECMGHGQPDGDGSGWDGTSMHTPACALCHGQGEVPAHFPCANTRDSCHGDPEVEECACWRRWREVDRA
jgi:hypothetical protein